MMARANFPHVRVHTKITTHPKLAALGLAEIGLWVLALAWCGEHETDGRIPRNVVRLLAARPRSRVVVATLVEAGVWTEAEDGYQIHDFAQWQEVRADKDARRDLWRSDKQERRGHVQRDSNGTFSAVQTDNTRTADGVRGVSTVRDPDPERDPDPPPPLRGVPPPVDSVVKPKRAKPGMACPPSAATAAEIGRWLSLHGFPDPDGDREFAKFLDHHRAKRTIFADWPAAWRNWKRRAAEWSSRDSRGGVQPGGGDWEKRDLESQETGT
jgi:hypothetical protein